MNTSTQPWHCIIHHWCGCVTFKTMLPWAATVACLFLHPQRWCVFFCVMMFIVLFGTICRSNDLEALTSWRRISFTYIYAEVRGVDHMVICVCLFYFVLGILAWHCRHGIFTYVSKALSATATKTCRIGMVSDLKVLSVWKLDLAIGNAWKDQARLFRHCFFVLLSLNQWHIYYMSMRLYGEESVH